MVASRRVYHAEAELLREDVRCLGVENKKLKEMTADHAAKCRGWVGEDPVWEQYLSFLAAKEEG